MKSWLTMGMAFKKERRLSFFAVTFSAFTLLFAAMPGSSQGVLAEGEPIANAGADQVADELTNVTLDGSGSSSPSGVPIATYEWIQVDSRCTSGGIEYYCPFVTLDGNGTAVATFQVPDVPPSAYYIFNLIATDENGLASAPDNVKISVNDLSNTSGQVPSTSTSPEPSGPVSTPQAEGEPVANAGADQVADELTNVTLDGSGSSSPSGVPIATYEWIQVDSRCTSAGTGIEYYCPFVTLDGNGTAVATFQVPDLPPSAYYIFNLIATDQNGLASAPDDVKISVNDLSNTSGQVPSTTTSPEPTTPTEEQPLAGESGNQSPLGQNATQGAVVTEIPDGSITASKLAPNSVTTDCQGVTPQLEPLSKGPTADKASPQKGRISKQSALTGHGFDTDSTMGNYMTVASTNNPVESIPGIQQQGQVSFKSPCVSKLADNTVINSKIADNAVDSKKIKDGAVKSADIGDSEVKSSDIGNGQVMLSKLGTDIPTLPKVTINQETVEIPVLFLGLKTFTVGCPDNTVTTGGGFLLDNNWWLGVRESAPHVGIGGSFGRNVRRKEGIQFSVF